MSNSKVLVSFSDVVVTSSVEKSDFEVFGKRRMFSRTNQLTLEERGLPCYEERSCYLYSNPLENELRLESRSYLYSFINPNPSFHVLQRLTLVRPPYRPRFLRCAHVLYPVCVSNTSVSAVDPDVLTRLC